MALSNLVFTALLLAAAVSCLGAADWRSFPTGQWISVSSTVPCFPNCSVVTFFDFQNETFLMARASERNGSAPPNKIYRWNNTGWTLSANDAGFFGAPPQCSITRCYFSSGGTLSWINPLEQNVTRRVLVNLPNPPTFNGTWTSGRVSDNFYVDPLDRWIVFLGGVNLTNVLMLDLSTLNYSVLTSGFMPPRLSGPSNIITTLNGDVFIRSVGAGFIARWSPGRRVWHNVTYDLSRLSKQGMCCSGIGSLTTDGTNVWAAADQGTFLFRGDAWQQVTYHWGATGSTVAGAFLFQQNARWSPALFPTTAIFFNHPTLAVRSTSPSPDGDAVFGALYEPTQTLPPILVDISVFVFPQNGSMATLTTAGYRNTNFNLGFATYFGSNGNDSAVSLGISKNGTREVIVSAVNFGGSQLILTNISSTISSAVDIRSLPGASPFGRGYFIFRNSSIPSTPFRAVRVATKIDHMAISRASSPRIAFAADGNVTVVDSLAENVLWTFGLAGMTFYRVSIATDGTVGALCFRNSDTFRKQLWVLSSTGSPRGSVDVAINLLSDVAITSDHGGIVWIGGQEQVDILLRKPYLRAFATTASLPSLFTMFPYSSAELTNSQNLASSRITQLHYGADGKLYMLGDSGGGNSVFRYNGYDLQTSTLQGSDDYTSAWNVGPSRVLYYARVTPNTGVIETSQFRLTRQVLNYLAGEMPTDDVSMFVNSRGELFLAGVMQCCSPGQIFHRVNCERTQLTKTGYHNYFLGLSRNFTRVIFWNSINRGGGTGAARGIVVGQNSVFALLESSFPEGSLQSDRLFTTPNADFPSRVGAGTDNDLWFAAFPSVVDSTSTCEAEALAEVARLNDPDYPERNRFATFGPPPPVTVPPTPVAAQASPVSAAIEATSSSAGIIVGVLIAIFIVAGVAALVVFKRDLLRSVAAKFTKR